MLWNNIESHVTNDKKDTIIIFLQYSMNFEYNKIELKIKTIHTKKQI